MDDSLSIDYCGFSCENPFLLSSSCVGANYDMCARALDMGWGGLVFKTIARSDDDEPSPRFAMLRNTENNLIGLKNLEQHWEVRPIEVDFEYLRRLKQQYPQKLIIASIIGRDDEEWTELAAISQQSGVDMIELNFSCPHTSDPEMTGAAVGEDPELVKQYCVAARKGAALPLIAKMTANATHMEIPALAAVDGGVNSISAINTIKCVIGVDLETMVATPDIQGKSAPGGYSGVGVRPIALRFIQELAACPPLRGIPLSGMGGIETWRDAAEFILMGASTVQVTTAIMHYGYRIIEDLISGMKWYLKEKRMDHISQMVGGGLPYIVKPDALTRGVKVYPVFHPETCIGCGRCYLSCRDGGHQALLWDSAQRLPQVLKDKCAACHLCTEVCPVQSIGAGILKKQQAV